MQEALEAGLGGVDDGDTFFNAEASPSPTPVLSAEAFWDAIRGSATTRVVLPDGERDMEAAARAFVGSLSPDQWGQLDQAFQDQVLAPRGGLYRACVGTGDLIRHLLRPLLDQAAGVLGGHLPITDVAQAEFTVGGEETAAARIADYFRKAAPLVGRAGAAEAETPGQHGFVLIPASDAGKRYGELVKQTIPEIHIVNVPGQADLMFCREQGGLAEEVLERVLHSCRPAYDEVANVPTVSPHARFDIQDWAPLEP
jgi:hypothetical protein